MNSLLENWDTYEKMLQDYANGTNSAAEEAEKSANSWEGSLNKFKNSVTDLTNNFVTSGRAKGFIDFFTGLIKGIDKVTSKFGALGSTVTLFSMLMISKSKTLHFSYDKDAQSIMFGTTALKNMTKATAAQAAKNLVLTATTKLLNAAISIGTSLIIGGIVSAITSWINKDEELQKQHEEEVRKMNEVNEQYKENTKNIQDNIAEYKKLIAQDQLSDSDREQLLTIQQQIVETYGEQAEGIDLVNGKLQEQLGILNGIADKTFQDALPNAIAVIKEYSDAANDNRSNDIFSFETQAGKEIAKVDGAITNTKTTYNDGIEVFKEFEDAANSYLTTLQSIQGFTFDYENDVGRGIETFTVSLDKMSSADKVEKLTKALHRLNTETTAEQKNTETYKALTNRLNGLLEIYKAEAEAYTKALRENAETLVKGLKPSELGTSINWTNVTDETFKEWYNAIISYYSTDRFDKEYQDAVIDWFDRNYTSIAQRMARGTTIAEIAYESEQAFKKSHESTGVFGFSFSAYKEDIDAVTKEMKNLKSVIDKIDSGKYSAIEDGFGLAESYPELLGYINDTDTLREKLVELRNASPDNLISDLQTVRKNLEQVGNYKQIAQIDALIEALRTLGDTAEETAEQLTAKDYLQIQQDGIDKIVDKLNEEKDAMNEVIDSLNDRKSEIEDYYDAQINALKTENEERERNVELQEKQKALDNAKRNKVRVYSASGFTIQEDSEAVAKAQDELDKAINDYKIDELEDQKDKAISVIEEQIDAQKKDVKSKEDEIQEWKDYKTQLTDEHNAIVDANSAYLEAQKQFVLDENSTFLDREQNLKDHLARMKALVDGEDEGTGDNGLYTDAFGVAPQAAINAILAMNGLLETNPLPQGSTSKSKVSGISSSLLSTGSPIILTDATKSVTTPIAPSSEQTKTFAPTLNISAEKVDEKAIKSWWDRQIVEEYNKFLVAN